MEKKEAIKHLSEWMDEKMWRCFGTIDREAFNDAIEALQEVQKHEETFEWCHDCKEYDTENHCCHRWSKVIRNTVEELKTDRPHGEWIERLAYNTDLDVDVPYIECDQCGHRPYFGGSYRPKYCEECGAEMDGNTDNQHGFTADEWYRDTFKGEEK